MCITEKLYVAVSNMTSYKKKSAESRESLLYINGPCLLGSCSRGFCARLYLDGSLKGELSANAEYEGEDSTPYLATGGRPTVLDGPMVLCSRSDNNTGRYFDGNIAYLGECLSPHEEIEGGEERRRGGERGVVT